MNKPPCAWHDCDRLTNGGLLCRFHWSIKPAGISFDASRKELEAQSRALGKPRQVGASADPCFWNPALDRPAYDHDQWHADADVIVDSAGKWRLCRPCSRLRRFKRFRSHRPVRSDVCLDKGQGKRMP